MYVHNGTQEKELQDKKENHENCNELKNFV